MKGPEELQKDLFRILGLVGHDISTPITVMDQYFGLWRDGLLGAVDEKQKRALEVLQNHSDRLKKIMRDLERITSWETIWEQCKRHLEKVDVQRIARTAAAQLDALFQSKNQSIVFENTAEPCFVVGDPDSLAAVFTHLLVNAYKFTPVGTKISIGIQDQGQEISVCVADNGRGMTPENLQRVFDSFYVGTDNLDIAQQIPKHVSSRLGLGLAICKNIVQSHQGRIGAKSVVGKYARFCFTLPKAGSQNGGK